MNKQSKLSSETIKSECYIADPTNLDRMIVVNTALDKAVEALEDKGYKQGYADGLHEGVVAGIDSME